MDTDKYEEHLIFKHDISAYDDPILEEYEVARNIFMLMKETLEEKNDEEGLRTLTCDYDSESGQRYSDMESEEENTKEPSKVYSQDEQYASDNRSRRYSSGKSSASDYSSDESSIKDINKNKKKRTKRNSDRIIKEKVNSVIEKQDVTDEKLESVSEKCQNDHDFSMQRINLEVKDRKKDVDTLHQKIEDVVEAKKLNEESFEKKINDELQKTNEKYTAFGQTPCQIKVLENDTVYDYSIKGCFKERWIPQAKIQLLIPEMMKLRDGQKC